MEARKEDDRDEAELVKQVKPLIEQAEKILNETNGAIKGADPDNRLSNKAKRNFSDHKATPEEQRLAEALKTVGGSSVLQPRTLLRCQIISQLMEDVHGTIEWAKDKLDSFPKAKKALGPLLDALGRKLPLPSPLTDSVSPLLAPEPLTQIVGGVGLLLAGVLNLLGKLVSHDSTLKLCDSDLMCS
jgi:hypothetical protein